MHIKRLHLILFNFDLFLDKIIHRTAFNMLENQTIILEINNIKNLFIKHGFINTTMQIIHIIYNENLYFSVIYDTH